MTTQIDNSSNLIKFRAIREYATFNPNSIRIRTTGSSGCLLVVSVDHGVFTVSARLWSAGASQFELGAFINRNPCYHPLPDSVCLVIVPVCSHHCYSNYRIAFCFYYYANTSRLISALSLGLSELLGLQHLSQQCRVIDN